MDFEEMVQRTVNAEAKAGLRSSIMVQDLNARYPKGYRLFHNTSLKVQTQGSKNSSSSEELKPKDSKPALLRDNVAEPAKKEDRKEKKKRFQNQRREHTEKQTPATDVNTQAPKKKIKARCFNCNKKGYYANKCTKPPKN